MKLFDDLELIESDISWNLGGELIDIVTKYYFETQIFLICYYLQIYNQPQTLQNTHRQTVFSKHYITSAEVTIHTTKRL